jgi:UDPglucose 6-dehydrogenase
VLGLSFKGETDDIRESPAIDLVQMLLAEGCSIVAYDPAAMDRARAELPESTTMQYAESSYAAARDADALLILTDWAEFAQLDLRKLNSTLRYPIVIDGRNLYDPQTMQDHGFTYMSVGRPAAIPDRSAVSA